MKDDTKICNCDTPFENCMYGDNCNCEQRMKEESAAADDQTCTNRIGVKTASDSLSGY